MLSEGNVGPDTLSDGASAPLRLDKTGALAVVQAAAALYEQGVRGKIFSAITAGSGVAPGTALGTTTPFTLANPYKSKVNLVVLSGGIGYVSGTLGAGTVVWAYGAESATAVTGTAITPVAAIVGESGAVGKAFTTATVPATPVAVRNAFLLGAALATTALGPYIVRDNVEGAIIVPPGCSITLMGIAAAGSTPLVMFDVCWAEIPV